MLSFADEFPCGGKQRLSSMKLHHTRKFLFFKYSHRLWDYTFFPIPLLWKTLHLRNEDKQKTVFLKKKLTILNKKKRLCLHQLWYKVTSNQVTYFCGTMRKNVRERSYWVHYFITSHEMFLLLIEAWSSFKG